MYKLVDSNYSFKLTKEGVEVTELNNQVIEITFNSSLKEFSSKYENLVDFLKVLKNLESFKNTSIYVLENNSKFKVDTKDILRNTFTLKKDYYTFQYSKESYVESLGFANYNYSNYYMPKWSTAFKFQYSNHCKLVEPLFTDIKINSLFISKMIEQKDDPEIYSKSKINFAISKKPSTNLTHKELSNIQFQGFISENYSINSENILNFSEGFNSIFLRRLQDITVNLKIRGIQNNSFVSEEVRLEDNSVVNLKYNYQSIYSLELINYEDLPESIDVKDLTYNISNVINITDYNLTYEKRKDNSYFEIEGDYLIYKRKNSEEITVFNLGYDIKSCSVYIDELDNISVLKDSNIYTGRIDASIDLQIEKDITYNNTKYIETTYLTSSEYLVEVLILDYIKDTHKEKVSIAVKSQNTTYYLNSNSELNLSDEEIFINLSDIKKDKISFELTLNHEIETLTITVNDIDGHHRKSNIIVHPKLNLKLSDTLDNSSNLVLIIDKNIFILDNSTLILRAAI